MKCPFCDAEVADSQDQEKNFWIHLPLVHKVTNAEDIINLIKTDTIPKAKIREKIKEVEESETDYKLYDVVAVLEDLLK